MIADEDLGSSEEGENYFVSMTDMMIGVLFIFIIMLMAFALDFRQKTDVQEDAVDVARQVAAKLADLQGQVRGEITTLDHAQEARRQLLRDIQAQLKTEGLDVQIDEANGVLRLTENAVRFASNSSDLADTATQKAKLNVGKIAHVLEHVLPNYAACHVVSDGPPTCGTDIGSAIETVFVEGHTDVTGVKDAADRERRNWQLSVERSVNTYRELLVQAPSLHTLRNHLQQEIVSVSGYSSTRPIDPGDGADAWTRNRRIDLRFVMELDNKERLKQILDLTDDMKAQIDRLTQASGRR